MKVDLVEKKREVSASTGKKRTNSHGGNYGTSNKAYLIQKVLMNFYNNVKSNSRTSTAKNL